MNIEKAKNQYGKCLTRKDHRNREWTAGTNDTKMKKIANRKVRRYKDLKSGNSYRKVLEHYEINDFH